MKIVAGLSCVDDYIRLVNAGADEVFIGYVPYKWTRKYGNLFAINRREVLYFNAQIKSLSDMKILKKMVDVYKVPVSITFNNIYYIEEQYAYVAEIIKELINIGFKKFIIADIGLLLYLKQNNIQCAVHLSGECAETNRLSIKFFRDFNLTRYIFNRKTTIDEMQSCIKSCGSEDYEFEAFVLNERCHYTGAFCSSFHCDEMIHLCEMPYTMGKVDEFSFDFPSTDEMLEKHYESRQGYKQNGEEIKPEASNKYKLGGTGCGLCYLKKLEIAGVTHLKVVGRGNTIENMEADVRSLRKAIDLIDKINDYNEYENIVNNKFFNGKCSENCYYNNEL